MLFKRSFFLVVGLTALCLGLLGIVLPLLPTVPFILLAAYCFARSNQRLHDWLVTHPWFAAPLTQWQQQRAMSVKLKRRTLILSTCSFGVSIMIAPLVWVKSLLLGMALILLWYINSIAEIDD